MKVDMEPIRHAIKCLDEYVVSELHDQMIEHTVAKECDMLNITDRQERLARYKESLFESRQMLHIVKNNLYGIIQEHEMLSQINADAEITH